MALMGRIAEKLKRWEDRGRSGAIADLDERVAAKISAEKNNNSPPLDEIIKKSWIVGQRIDISNIGYGPTHWKGGERFLRAPESYYFFLAGLVKSQNFKRIFEIGTHYGGSILSMMRGIASVEQQKVVTVDITDLNPILHTLSGLKKIVGDANTEEIIQRSIIYLGNEPIDLLYVDADHRFFPTLANLCVYGMLLRPRMVVIDDIVLNDSMRAMWNVVRAAYGNEAINCVDVIPEIRSSACGFGLIRFR